MQFSLQIKTRSPSFFSHLAIYNINRKTSHEEKGAQTKTILEL